MARNSIPSELEARANAISDSRMEGEDTRKSVNVAKLPRPDGLGVNHACKLLTIKENIAIELEQDMLVLNAIHVPNHDYP